MRWPLVPRGLSLFIVQVINLIISQQFMSGTVLKNQFPGLFCRILFQCSELEGAAAVLQNDNSDPCEFYFVWQTPAGCPIKKAVSAAGENCTVVDPLYHMTFNLSTMHRKRDYQVITGSSISIVKVAIRLLVRSLLCSRVKCQKVNKLFFQVNSLSSTSLS